MFQSKIVRMNCQPPKLTGQRRFLRVVGGVGVTSVLTPGYLLAHGMGKPVANATTQVPITEAGTWHVWVRNRDWCKGDWESPGRFKVLIDGKPLEPVFGQGSEK